MNPAEARPPSRLYLMMEGRAFFEFGATMASLPRLRAQPGGDGHAVIVLPGLGASDFSTDALRRYLRDRGYDARPWGLGRNLGLRGKLLDNMVSLLRDVYESSGRRVSLVGWSLGGVFARELAKIEPGMVRQVITLGSPFGGNPRASHAWRIYEYFADHRVDTPPIETTLAEAPPVPTTSIYSRTDGVVAWECCHNEAGARDDVENIEVEGSHVGLGVNVAVLAAVADRLAQPEGEWQPFDRDSMTRRYLYKDTERGRHQ